MKKPLERDVLICSVRQRSPDGDRKYLHVEFLQGNVDGARARFGSLYKYGSTHCYLQRPSSHYSSLFKTGELGGTDQIFFLFARFPRTPLHLEASFLVPREDPQVALGVPSFFQMLLRHRFLGAWMRPQHRISLSVS